MAKFSGDSYLDSCSRINHGSSLSEWRQDIHCGVFILGQGKASTLADLFLFKQFLKKQLALVKGLKNVNKRIRNVSIEPYEKEWGSPDLHNLKLTQCVTKRKVSTLIYEKPVSFCSPIENWHKVPIQTFLKDVSFSLLWAELIVSIPYSYAESENTTNSFDLNGHGASQGYRKPARVCKSETLLYANKNISNLVTIMAVVNIWYVLGHF